jgi:predicted dehydrogenase
VTLGVGIISFAHLHAVSYATCLAGIDSASLVAVADDDQHRGQAMASRFGVDYHGDVYELLERRDIQAVIVTSANADHHDHVIAAAGAGKHVMCEKPIATARDDALAMLDACHRNGVRFQTAFPMRFSPPAIALREAIQAGALGTPLAVMVTNHGRMPAGWFSDPMRAGGGAVMDHTVHVADLLRWTFGAKISRVYAEADTRIHAGIAVDDVGMLLLTMDNGMFASLDPSWSRPRTWPTWGGLTMEVIGDQGVVSMDAFKQNLQIFDDRQGTYRLEPWSNGGDPPMIQAFIDAVAADREPDVTGNDGLKALEVALCAYESARRHEPVNCPDILTTRA